MAVSKIIYGGQTLIDLTADTIKKEKLLKGYTAHGADGELIEGECDFDANTQDATSTESEVLEGTIFYNKGARLVGKMKNNEATIITISERDEEANILQGFHDGAGKAVISEDERSKIIPSNIRSGVSILGIEGTMSGLESVLAQIKEAIPNKNAQTVLPDEGYNYISQVNIAPIPYVESDNSAGGKTVAIA